MRNDSANPPLMSHDEAWKKLRERYPTAFTHLPELSEPRFMGMRVCGPNTIDAVLVEIHDNANEVGGSIEIEIEPTPQDDQDTLRERIESALELAAATAERMAFAVLN